MKREQEGSKKVTEITLKKKLKVEIWYVLSVVAHGTSVKKKKKKMDRYGWPLLSLLSRYLVPALRSVSRVRQVRQKCSRNLTRCDPVIPVHRV